MKNQRFAWRKLVGVEGASMTCFQYFKDLATLCKGYSLSCRRGQGHPGTNGVLA